jgi:hypothetical protein
MMNYKNALKCFVSETTLGWLDYSRSSHEDRDWSGPFNGQLFRRHIFAAVCKKIPISYVVETGTFRGVTTEYLASQIDVPVFSIESNQRNYGFARARLRKLKRVKLYLGDSAKVLGDLFDRNAFPDGQGFFYLDAHWDKHLPLRQEVSLIFEKRPSSVVMIDDFEVPGDPGYLFDDYGEGGSLTLGYLAETMSRFGLVGFFPNCPSAQESGKKRGMLVLANESVAAQLRELTQLRENK